MSAWGKPFSFVLGIVALALLAGCSQPDAAKPAGTGGGGTAAAKDEFVFGVILVGPKNDHGWSEAHYTAGQYLEKKLPGAKMLCIENLNEAAKPGVTVPQVVDDLVTKGAKLVITTSDHFQDGTLEAAKKHSGVYFVNVSGDHAWKEGKNFKAPPNYSNLMGRMEYGKMMMGFTAGLTTKSGKVAYLGPLINDETRRLVDCAYLGARHAWVDVRKQDPKAFQFKVTWIGFWIKIPGVTADPTQVADDFLNSGFDVVLSGIDTTEALVQAKKAKAAGKAVWTLPYDYREAGKGAEEVCLGVPYFNWGPSYVKIAKEIKEGKWKPFFDWIGPDWKDLNNPDTSAIGFIKGPALSAENAKLVDEFTAKLADGSLNLLKGPLNFQNGSVWLKEGETATDLQLWYVPQLLEGMEGKSE